MDHIVKTLSQSKIFGDLKQSTIVDSLMPHSNIRNFNAKESVIELLEPVNRLGVVLAGTLHVIQIFSDGNLSLVDILTPSYTLGSDLICTYTKKAPYSVIAAAVSKVIFFPASVFLEPGKINEPERLLIVNRLLTLLSQESIRKYYRVAILSQNRLRDRVMTYLSMQARKRNSHTFSIPFTREEMASFLCVNRSALSHELSKMKTEGLINFKKNQFSILIQEPFLKNP